MFELEEERPERLELVLEWLDAIGAVKPKVPELNSDKLEVWDGTGAHKGDPNALWRMREGLDRAGVL